MTDKPATKKKFDFITMRREAPDLLQSVVDTLSAPDMIVVFNRLSVPRDIQYDGRVTVIPGHQLKVLPLFTAMHAIDNAHCFYASEDGTEEIEDWWLVTPSYHTFCMPYTAQEEDRILHPENYYNLEEEANHLPIEAKGYGQATTWRRVKKRPTRPRTAFRPIVTEGPIVTVFQARGGA